VVLVTGCELTLFAVGFLPGGPGTGYNGLGWEPKLAFSALAQADTGAAPGAGATP